MPQTKIVDGERGEFIKVQLCSFLQQRYIGQFVDAGGAQMVGETDARHAPHALRSALRCTHLRQGDRHWHLCVQ